MISNHYRCSQIYLNVMVFEREILKIQCIITVKGEFLEFVDEFGTWEIGNRIFARILKTQWHWRMNAVNLFNGGLY